MSFSENRDIYRSLYNTSDLVYTKIKLDFADISIGSTKDVTNEAKALLTKAYKEVEDHIQKYPVFKDSLSPLTVPKDFCAKTNTVIAAMYTASTAAGVGPMAAVAGAIAQYIGRNIKEVDEIIIENGGDIYLRSLQERVVLIYAGNSPLSLKIGIKLPVGEWGVCTSSGTFGHSLSFGNADAALVVSKDAALADTVSTELGNRIKDDSTLEAALNYAMSIPNIIGAVGIVGSALGAVGGIELVRVGK